MVRSGFAIVAGLMVLCLGSSCRADVFNMGSGLTNLEMALVGDPGNTGQSMPAGAHWSATTCGAVDHAYRIGKYEVTAGQYCDFLNHKANVSDPYGLYNPGMNASDMNAGDGNGCNILRTGTAGSYTYTVAADWANRPVNYVGFWDACRFANWVNNGQGSGDTETGAYTLNGYTGTGGASIARNPGAKWFIPSENEWHKAAYYKGGGTNAGYWTYPTQNNSAPSNVLGSPTDPGNNATFCNSAGTVYTINDHGRRTEVGAHENSESAYGTFDQGGNIWEWNEAVMWQDASGYVFHGVRGGCFGSWGADPLKSTFRSGDWTLGEYSRNGFRLAAVVPEPSSLMVLAGGLASLLGLRRRRP